MTFSTEEFELIDRLRQKYAQEDVTKASAVLQATLSKDQEHDQAGSARSVDRLVDAHICPVCQGSGRHAEVYHFRRLVSNCSHCDGDGLLMSGGKPSKATESGNKAAAANSTTHQAATSQAVMDSGSNAGSQAKRLKSTRQLKRQVQQLEQQMQAVTKEQGELAAAHAFCSSEGKGQLQNELLLQLGQHLSSLQSLHQAKLAALRR